MRTLPLQKPKEGEWVLWLNGAQILGLALASFGVGAATVIVAWFLAHLFLGVFS